MRFLGIDYGAKRLGLALSDHSATMARPWKVLPVNGHPETSAAVVADEVRRLRASDDPEIDGLVVGLPRRLNGEDNAQTPLVRRFVAALLTAVDVPVATQDERLTSIEAEARLAEREPDWRKRKALIDAEAASILLQDYLDNRR